VRPPRGRGPGARCATSRGAVSRSRILEAAYVPLLLLALAGIGVMRLGVALRAGIWTSIIALAFHSTSTSTGVGI